MLVHDPDLSQRLLDDLRKRMDAPRLAYAEPPERILSGAENQIYAVRFAGGLECLDGPLILRCYRPERDHAGVHFEAALHRALADQEYPAPRVAFACDDPAALGGAYLLMDRLPGSPPLGEITRLDQVFASVPSALRALPHLVYDSAIRVPRLLGDWMLKLHAVDAGRIIEALEAVGAPLRRFSVEGRLEALEQRAAAAGLDGLAPGLAWLRSNYELPTRRVLCHADFHFLNLLVEGPRLTGVVDWSLEHLCFEDRSFDVGNTRAILDIKVPGLSAAARPLFELAQWRLREGFSARYLRTQPLDPERISWAEAFRYVREMVGVGEALRRGESSGADFLLEDSNPWLIPEVTAGVLAGIARRTGVTVSLPKPA